MAYRKMLLFTWCAYLKMTLRYIERGDVGGGGGKCLCTQWLVLNLCTDDDDDDNVAAFCEVIAQVKAFVFNADLINLTCILLVCLKLSRCIDRGVREQSGGWWQRDVPRSCTHDLGTEQKQTNYSGNKTGWIGTDHDLLLASSSASIDSCHAVLCLVAVAYTAATVISGTC